jgi:phospholipid-binding lipoprotein MlaA
MARRSLRALLLVSLLCVGAGSGARAEDPEPGDGVYDPFEDSNRWVFGVNEKLDLWILEPVAKGWDFVLPDLVEESVGNFFVNLRFPIYVVNDVLQGKPVAALQDVARFALNTTAGCAGLFDPATEVGLPQSREDFGQTLGVWGVPPGPYWVLPLFGPSNPRDTAGLLVDSQLRVYTWFIPFYVSGGVYAIELVNTRSSLLETIAEERKAAFDFYAAVRNAHVQLRDNQVRDSEPSEETDDDLYELQEDLDVIR